MRGRLGAITALCALACASGIACGGGGSHDTTTIITKNAFPQGYLPVLFGGASGPGDVAFQAEGDLYAVDGNTPRVTRVSRIDGAVNASFADLSGNGVTRLLSIATGVGDDTRLF